MKSKVREIMKECFKFEMEIETENRVVEEEINNIYIDAGNLNGEILEENEDSYSQNYD